MENKTNIICITGHPASGKDVVADYFVLRGFHNISGGDILRSKMKELGLPIDRDAVRGFVTEKRKEYGNQYPYDEAFAETLSGNVVVSGIRNTAEYNVFKNYFDEACILVAVDATPENRYIRAKARNRIGDNIGFADFLRQENEECNNPSGTHEVDTLITLADHVIENNGSKDEFIERVETLFRMIQ